MEFDKSVPFPDTHSSRVKTLREMQIGESFAIEDNNDAAKWRQAMWKASRTGDRYFISRTFLPGKVRIWRKA